MTEKSSKKIKIILLGDAGVGKSAIFRRFIYNQFQENTYMSTIGADFEIKTIKYKKQNYRVGLFDTAGEERFRSITKSYYQMANACFIIFDLSNENSLKGINFWIDSIKETSENIKFIIL